MAFLTLWVGLFALAQGLGAATLSDAASDAQVLASTTQDFTAADPRDPFVRGLMRLDKRSALYRQVELLLREAYELKLGIDLLNLEGGSSDMLSLGLPLSGSDFLAALEERNFRLDGSVLRRSEADRGTLFWSGIDRRWVYERKGSQPLAEIAARFNMLLPDLLAINGVSRIYQLRDPDRIYVSPRDNGPLTHIVRRGDTLGKLALAYQTGVDALQVRNGLEDKNNLQVGERLLIREKTLDANMTRTALPARRLDAPERKICACPSR